MASCKKDMEMLKQLAEHVLTKDGPITLMTDDGRDRAYFAQIPVYKAKYIIGVFEDTRTGTMYEGPHQVAIVSEGTVYMTDFSRLLSVCEWDDLRNGAVEHVMTLDQKCKQLNEEAVGPIFQEFFDGLSDDAVYLEEWRVCQIRVRARKMALGVSTEPLIQPPEQILDKDDVAKIVNGQIDLRTAAIEALSRNEERWTNEKALVRKTQEFLDSEDLTAPWERELAKALDIPAKTVIIEAAHDGHVASEKMDRSLLLKKLAEEDYLRGYEFPSYKAGEKFFKALSLDLIYCRDITKIVFRGKTLYERPVG